MGAPGNSGSRGLILQESVWPLTTLSPLGGLAPARGRLRRGAVAGGAAMPSEVLGGDLLPALRDTLLSKLVEPET